MSAQNEVKEISARTAQDWVINGALLVDVREAEELIAQAYDVPNLLHVPLSEFEARFTEIPKDIPVVMVCKSGGRSMRATSFLTDHGYEQVVNLEHGIIGWAENGFPIKVN